MVDVARLVLAVDSTQLKSATREVDSLTRAGNEAEKSTGRMSAGMKKAAVAAAALGVAAAAAATAMVFRGAIREAEALENRLSKMNAIIEATGGAAQKTSDQLLEQARALNRVTLESTDGIMQAQQTLLTFRSIQGEVFDRALQSAADMTAALGGDLNNAALQLAKALENPTEGLSALSRSGTVFTNDQKDMVRAMVEAGDVAKAQGFILDELDRQYAGAANAGSELAFAQDSFAQTVQETLIKINDAIDLTGKLAAVFRVLERAAQGVGWVFDQIGAAAAFFSGEHDNLAGAIATAAEAMNQEAKQALQLSNRLLEMGEVSYDVLGAKIALIETTLRGIEVARQEAIALAKTSEAYMDAARTAEQARDIIKTYQDLVAQGFELSTEDLASYDDWINRLRSAVELQESIVAQAGELGPEFDQANAELQLLKAYLADAEGNTVRLGENTENVNRSLIASAGAATNLAGNLANATGQASALSSFLSGLPGALNSAASRIAGLQAGMNNLASGGDRMSASVAEYRAQLEASLPPLQSLQDGQREFVQNAIEDKVRLFEQEQQLSEAYREQVAALGGVASATSSAGAAAGKAADEVGDLAKEVDKLNEEADKGLTPVEKYATELERLQELRALGLSDDAFALELERINDALAQATPIISSFTSAFEGFLSGSIKSFKDFANTILNDFRNLLAQMIATALRNKILIPIATGGSIAGTAATAAGGLGGGGGLLGGAGGALGIGGAFIGGLTNVISSTISGGLSMGLASIGGQVSAALAGGSLTAIAGAVGALALPVAGIALAVTALTNAFSRSYYGSGVRGTLSGEGAEASDVFEFDFFKGGAFKSSKTVERALSDDLEKAFTESIDNITGQVKSFADAIGLSSDAMASFQTDMFTIWTSGPHGEKLEENLTKLFTEFSDELAATVLGGEWLDNVDGAFAELERLGQSLISVNETMRILGNTLFEGSIAGAEMAAQLVEMFGGLENFNAAHASYLENFYSEQERLEIRMNEMARAFEALSIEVPETNAAFRALVEAQDLTTQAGQQTYAALLLLSGEFADIQATAANAAGAVAGLEGALTGLSEAALSEIRNLERQLLQLQGNIAAVRAMTLEDLQSDEARKLQQEIFDLQDKQAAAARKTTASTRSSTSATNALTDAQREAEAIASERLRLENQILELEGNTVELRRRELAELDASNQPLQQRVWMLEDEARIMDEREGLERQLLELQGNVAELRRRELAELDETNRGLQLAIWHLEDFNEAIRELNENDFATLVDFNRATALEANRRQNELNDLSGSGIIDSVLSAGGAAFEAATSGMTAAIESLTTTMESLADSIAGLALRSSTSRPSFLEQLLGMAMPKNFHRRTPFAQQQHLRNFDMSDFNVRGAASHGEIVQIKEYLDQLVKLNIKQERTLKEIELQGETA